MRRTDDPQFPIPESSALLTQSEYHLLELLGYLYGGGIAHDLANRLLSIARREVSAADTVQTTAADAVAMTAADAVAMTAATALLITYGDTVNQPDHAPLATLKRFADEHLRGAFSGIHVLPFFPYSSDDGFAVVDYTMVRQELGDWSDIRGLGEHFDLMFDLVINHCSREHIWFADFVSDRVPGKDFFVQPPADEDLTAVVRPRNTPLVSEIQTYAGVRRVWTTFSEDQIDLNFANPEVLCRFVEILFDYVHKGARYIRLDAVAFLWKRAGTTCMSLPETHLVVKVLRALLDACACHVTLLTETNVPHAENVSYFGQQDEAHMVYQFSLAPLLVYSYAFHDARYLHAWACDLEPAPDGCAYLNFIASHDGIGLRPLEGLIPEHEIERLVNLMHERGGFVSMRTGADGRDRPYELNIALFSAFGGAMESVPAFVAAHQLLLAFQGVPALYFNALFARMNDMGEVQRTGRTRSINRGKWSLHELVTELKDSAMVTATVYDMLTRSLKTRREQPAFAPGAEQRVAPSEPTLYAMHRIAADQHILVLASFVSVAQRVSLEGYLDDVECRGPLRDLLTGVLCEADTDLFLAPYQVVWLELDRGRD